MIRYLLNNGFDEVVWVDPYPARLPTWSDLHRSMKLHDQGTFAEVGINVLKPNFLPIDPLPGGYWLNAHLAHPQIVQHLRSLLSTKEYVLGIGKPSCLAVDLLSSFRGVSSFYDAMDDFPQFHGGLSQRSVLRNEACIADTAQHIFCSSSALQTKFEGYNHKPWLVKNAFDAQLIPPPQPRKQLGRPVIGYIGSLGSWFDWNAVCALSEAGKEYDFKLIGPQLVPAPARLPANISILPPCRHDEVPRYLTTFAVGLIPFKINRLTDSVDPVKYYEYRASGIPIITSRFGQMRCRTESSGVFFYDSESPKQLLAQALTYTVDQQELATWRSANTWSNRIELLSKVLVAA